MPASQGKRALVAAAALALAACSGDRAPGQAIGRAAERDGAEGWRIVTIADFNGDGLGDVLWTDPKTGRIAVFLLRDTHLLEAGRAIPGPPEAGWAPVTALDYTFDSIADVSWFNPRDNRAAVWLMRGTHLAEPGREIRGPEGPGWVLSYAGDFTGDGLGDFIWHDADNGRFTIWLMSGSHVTEKGPEIPGPPGDGWIVPTTGDFNGDGMSDVVFLNPEKNRMAIWLMAGTEVLERGPEIPGPEGSGWLIPSAGDFDGDGLADIIWDNPGRGVMCVWLMRGTCLREPGPETPGPPGPGWSVGSALDTNGDGMADTVWQNPGAGRFAVWLMAGTHVLEPGAEMPGPL
jgi:FG-GAP-like repeat